MDSKIKILIVILVVGILLAGMLFFISTGALIIIKTCTSDEDCKSTCTWGCINKISIYQEREKCYFLPHCECIKNKCVPILENCSLLEKQIKEKIAKANYCEKDEDCIIVEEFGCPFGCYNLINKKELEAIRSLVKKYDECIGGTRCLYKCPAPPESVGCENRVCIVKLSQKEALNIANQILKSKCNLSFENIQEVNLSRVKGELWALATRGICREGERYNYSKIWEARKTIVKDGKYISLRALIGITGEFKCIYAYQPDTGITTLSEICGGCEEIKIYGGGGDEINVCLFPDFEKEFICFKRLK